jgi:hypothetical protein
MKSASSAYLSSASSYQIRSFGGDVPTPRHAQRLQIDTGDRHGLMQKTRLLALRFVEGFRQAQRERDAANQRCLISWDADLKPRALRGDSRSADSPQSKVGLCALPQIARQKAADSLTG